MEIIHDDVERALSAFGGTDFSYRSFGTFLIRPRIPIVIDQDEPKLAIPQPERGIGVADTPAHTAAEIATMVADQPAPMGDPPAAPPRVEPAPSAAQVRVEPPPPPPAAPRPVMPAPQAAPLRIEPAFGPVPGTVAPPVLGGWGAAPTQFQPAPTPAAYAPLPGYAPPPSFPPPSHTESPGYLVPHPPPAPARYSPRPDPYSGQLGAAPLLGGLAGPLQKPPVAAETPQPAMSEPRDSRPPPSVLAPSGHGTEAKLFQLAWDAVAPPADAPDRAAPKPATQEGPSTTEEHLFRRI